MFFLSINHLCDRFNDFRIRCWTGIAAVFDNPVGGKLLINIIMSSLMITLSLIKIQMTFFHWTIKWFFFDRENENVLKEKKGIHGVYKETQLPKNNVKTQKTITTLYTEPSQSTKSTNDMELTPLYNLT